MKTAEILLAESCREQVCFESGFKQRKGRRISEIGSDKSSILIIITCASVTRDTTSLRYDDTVTKRGYG